MPRTSTVVVATSSSCQQPGLCLQRPNVTHINSEILTVFLMHRSQLLQTSSELSLGCCSKDKMPDFGGETPYSVMFGPDICGHSTKKVHAILTDKKGRNLEFKPTVPAKTDELTHVYTYILHPNNTYQAPLQLAEIALLPHTSLFSFCFICFGCTSSAG